MTPVMQRQITKTDDFNTWLDGLQDEIGKAAITDRIDRVKNGTSATSRK